MNGKQVVVGRLKAVVGPSGESARRAVKVGGVAPDWIQIFPDGPYTYDWEGKVETAVCDAESRRLVIAEFIARGNDLVIDYEHQTLDGGVAPAAGWIKELEDRGSEGLWARVEWTEQAKKFLLSGEYRYDSPVFRVSKATRRVIALDHVALTNWPATHNRTALDEQQIAAKVEARLRKASKQWRSSVEGSMDTKGIVISLIKWGANLPDTATNNDVKAYLKSLDDQIPANDELFILPDADEASVAAAKTRLADHLGAQAPTQVAAKTVLDELELPENATLVQVHARIGELRAPAGMVAASALQAITAERDELKTRVAALEAKTEDEKLAQLEQKYAKKLPPAKLPWFRALAKRHGLAHAEGVAKEMKDELPDSAAAGAAPPDEPAIDQIVATRRVGEKDIPVDQESAMRRLKVQAIQKEDAKFSDYRDAAKELERREVAAAK